MKFYSIFILIVITIMCLYQDIITHDFSWLVFGALTWISFIIGNDINRLDKEIKKLKEKTK